MSLINDMLRDIDRVEQPTEARVLPAGLAPVEPKKSDIKRYWLPGLAATAVLYAVVVEWNALGLFSSKKSPMPIPEPVAFNSKWLNVTAELAPQDATDAEEVISVSKENSSIESASSALVEIPAVSANPDTQIASNTNAQTASNTDAIARLLNAAELAVQENRLTSPVGDNAYQYYKTVLLLDKTNEAALQGIASLQQRYIALLESAVKDERFEAAQRYIKGAQVVGVADSALSVYQERLRAGEKKPVVQTQKPVITLAVTGDEQMSAELRAKGWRAESSVLNWLASASEIGQTAVALADFYAAQNRVNELLKLEELLQKRGHATAYYAAAQTAVLRGDYARGIQQLTSVEFSSLAEEQRLRLLGGMQQKIGDYAAAMVVYARLTERAPNNVNDWLGLAVSADGNKQIQIALRAYENVLRLRHPDTRVMQFAQLRWQELSPSR